MCGIVGYVGHEQAAPILLDGLTKLEYRGYDSAGIAVINENGIELKKAKGRILNLRNITANGTAVSGTVGIGHTRWATHGKPSDNNSHPHNSMSGKFSVVHNGIIENYLQIREMLQKKGFVFKSDTDTEVVTQLLDYFYKGDLLAAVEKMMHTIEGSYALGIICADFPDRIVAVRKDSPLIIGLSDNANYIASDVTALVEHTRSVCYMGDQNIAVLTDSGIELYDQVLEKIDYEVKTVDWDINAAEKGGYEHFMLKEMMEQPKVIRDTVRPRIINGEVVLDNIGLGNYADKINRIVITACGSAYHAGVVGKYAIERLSRIPVEVDLASEFRYRSPIIDSNTLVIVISQSGETADTLAALKEAKRLGAHTLGVVNVVGSAIATAADDVLYTWAGPEIAVATTKAYSVQLCVMYLIGIYLGRVRGLIDDAENKALLDEMQLIPDYVESILGDSDYIKNLAARFYTRKNMFFIGRNIDYASSLEGSLKLKEISYIHSEAYAAGELKHGTISLIEDGRVVVALACQDSLFEKLLSNIREVKARGAVVIGLAQEHNSELSKEVDYCLYVPNISSIFTASLSCIPLQLFAYYVAVMNGCDVDKPRNLAKSVTVE